MLRERHPACVIRIFERFGWATVPAAFSAADCRSYAKSWTMPGDEPHRVLLSAGVSPRRCPAVSDVDELGGDGIACDADATAPGAGSTVPSVIASSISPLGRILSWAQAAISGLRGYLGSEQSGLLARFMTRLLPRIRRSGPRRHIE